MILIHLHEFYIYKSLSHYNQFNLLNGILLDTIRFMKNLTDPGQLLKSIRTQAGLGLREAARRADTSHATFRAYEIGNKIPTVETFLRLVESCNHSLEVIPLPRIKQHNGVLRGDELAEVLHLADQFPVSSAEKLMFPKFPPDSS